MLINRDYYLNQIINSMWDGQIKVITGLRRVGKSVLLFDLFKVIISGSSTTQFTTSAPVVDNRSTISANK